MSKTTSYAHALEGLKNEHKPFENRNLISNYKDETINIGCRQMLDSLIVSKR